MVSWAPAHEFAAYADAVGVDPRAVLSVQLDPEDESWAFVLYTPTPDSASVHGAELRRGFDDSYLVIERREYADPARLADLLEHLRRLNLRRK